MTLTTRNRNQTFLIRVCVAYCGGTGPHKNNVCLLFFFVYLDSTIAKETNCNMAVHSVRRRLLLTLTTLHYFHFVSSKLVSKRRLYCTLVGERNFEGNIAFAWCKTKQLQLSFWAVTKILDKL